ncbi:PilW family protein [Dyella humi]|uniref:PilW family protein n=1 Tax=Dyella humi TaxID=1770547 RepID=A0ABW8IG71_9GAMM
MTRAHQRGLSLISLLIAMTIGVFLLAGLFNVWLQTRNTFNAQNSLAQLQDAERMAVTTMASIVQSGGFYPLGDNYSTNPAPPSPLFTPTNVFTASGNFAAGQYIWGSKGTSGSASNPSDTIYVRFMSDGSALDCLGQSQSDRALVTNTYTIDASGNLKCGVTSVLNGATTTTPSQTVVSGISSMTTTYGVDPGGTGSATQYMNASAVTSNAYWSYVRSVKIQLIFTNPLASQTGQPATVNPITRIVAVTQTTNSI